jgi:hypothetical protein
MGAFVQRFCILMASFKAGYFNVVMTHLFCVFQFDRPVYNPQRIRRLFSVCLFRFDNSVIFFKVSIKHSE